VGGTAVEPGTRASFGALERVTTCRRRRRRRSPTRSSRWAATDPAPDRLRLNHWALSGHWTSSSMPAPKPSPSRSA